MATQTVVRLELTASVSPKMGSFTFHPKTGLLAFTFLCEKPDFFGRKTVLPTAWRREERKHVFRQTFFGARFPEQSTHFVNGQKSSP
jgi:hypothetical protein